MRKKLLGKYQIKKKKKVGKYQMKVAIWKLSNEKYQMKKYEVSN